MHRSDGAVLEAELLGHKSEADYLEVGQWFELTTDEEELSGRAQIVAIDDDVTIGEGEGNLVVSRFKTTSQQIEVARLFLENDEQIVGTPRHRTWCLNRQQFIGLSEFVAGDEVESYNGPVKVICVETTAEPIQQVFNLEIAGQHVYRIGKSGCLVHNTGECVNAPKSLARNDAALYRALGGARAGHTAHHLVPVSVAQQRGLRGFFQRAAREGWDINGSGNGLLIDNIIRHVNHHPRYNAYVAQRIQGYINKSGGLKNINGSQAKQYLESLSSDMRRFLNNSSGDINKLFEWIK